MSDTSMANKACVTSSMLKVERVTFASQTSLPQAQVELHGAINTMVHDWHGMGLLHLRYAVVPSDAGNTVDTLLVVMETFRRQDELERSMLLAKDMHVTCSHSTPSMMAACVLRALMAVVLKGVAACRNTRSLRGAGFLGFPTMRHKPLTV